MLYHIVGFEPRPSMEMSGCAFCIKLYPEWKRLVAKSEINQENIYYMLKHRGNSWLDGYGYGQKSQHGIGGRLYTYRDICVRWGEWGPEHITVPGCNATGLDIDYDNCHSAPDGGKILVPHNIDNTNQSGLILTIFLEIANIIVTKKEIEMSSKEMGDPIVK